MTKSAGIGYSTALLWIDVAENFFDVNEQIADSNPLELTLRQIRDAIRDARQRRGEGKPGSGRRKPKATETPNDGENGDVAEHSEIEADNTDTEEATPTNQRWENAAAAAEAEAAELSGAAKNEPKSQDPEGYFGFLKNRLKDVTIYFGDWTRIANASLTTYRNHGSPLLELFRSKRTEKEAVSKRQNLH